jgi:hypothetical protein
VRVGPSSETNSAPLAANFGGRRGSFDTSNRFYRGKEIRYEIEILSVRVPGQPD